MCLLVLEQYRSAQPPAIKTNCCFSIDAAFWGGVLKTTMCMYVIVEGVDAVTPLAKVFARAFAIDISRK